MTSLDKHTQALILATEIEDQPWPNEKDSNVLWDSAFHRLSWFTTLYLL